MTSPVVRTPLYGLRKFADGQPLADVGVIVNDIANNLEAALQLEGITPPDLATFLAQLSAFNTLNTAGAFVDTGWVAVTNSATIRSGFTPQVRRLGKLVVARGGWTTTSQTANTTLTVGTVPATVTVSGTAYNLRPSTALEITPGMSSASSVGKLSIATTGAVSTAVAATPPSYMELDGITWTVD